jgi:hypothetical protein
MRCRRRCDLKQQIPKVLLVHDHSVRSCSEMGIPGNTLVAGIGRTTEFLTYGNLSGEPYNANSYFLFYKGCYRAMDVSRV